MALVMLRGMIVKMFINHLIGFLAAGFMLLSLSYSLLKRLRFKCKKLLNFHCYAGYVSVVLVLIHVFISMNQISFSSGLIALLSMLFILVSGTVMRYFGKIISKNILILRYMHITFAVIFISALLIHIIEYFLLT